MNQALSPGGEQTERLDGLDLARFAAFIGMVIVNFAVVMEAKTERGILGFVLRALEGRAAASFVVLAGIGLGLASLRNQAITLRVTIRRALFLLALGLVNTAVFAADIIHYYAIYFVISAMFLKFGNGAQLGAILLVNLVFLLLLLVLDFDRGWNWDALSYSDFWTPEGFLRNLFFNGWHPVFPWVGFMFFGVFLSRMPLARLRTQRALLLSGLACIAIAEALSTFLAPVFMSLDPELAALASTQPIPPSPFYSLAGIGAASVVIGGCLMISNTNAGQALIRWVAPAGRQTLTLYFAHIYLGMGGLEMAGLLRTQPLSFTTSIALIFCILAALYANFWARHFKRGPVEALMRHISG